MRDVTLSTNGWAWLRPNHSYKSVHLYERSLNCNIISSFRFPNKAVLKGLFCLSNVIKLIQSTLQNIG
jgi:hypothetical protein